MKTNPILAPGPTEGPPDLDPKNTGPVEEDLLADFSALPHRNRPE